MAFTLLLLIISLLLLLFLFIYISGGGALLVGSGRVYILLPRLMAPQGVCLSQLTPSAAVPLMRGSPPYILLYLQLHLCHHIQLSLINFYVGLYFHENFLDCALHFYQSLVSPRLVMGSHPICPPFYKGRWQKGALISAVRAQGRPDRCLLRAKC